MVSDLVCDVAEEGEFTQCKSNSFRQVQTVVWYMCYRVKSEKELWCGAFPSSELLRGQSDGIRAQLWCCRRVEATQTFKSRTVKYRLGLWELGHCIAWDTVLVPSSPCHQNRSIIHSFSSPLMWKDVGAGYSILSFQKNASFVSGYASGGRPDWDSSSKLMSLFRNRANSSPAMRQLRRLCYALIE